MKMKILGIGKRRAGVSKSGKDYDFAYLYCTHEAEDVEGEKTEEVHLNFRSPVNYPAFQVGDIINVSYDKNGFLEEIAVVDKTGKASPSSIKINANS